MFAFLGIALGVSQLTRSVPWSRGLGLVALTCIAIASAVLRHDEWRESAPIVFDTLAQVLPAAHKLDLWRMSMADVVPSLVMLIALGFVYFAMGHVRFARRDA